MSVIKVEWSSRPARLIEKGAEVSVIEWMDTQTEQAISNSQYVVIKSEIGLTDLIQKHKIKKAGPKRTATGPTKKELVTALIDANPSLSRKELLTKIQAECNMTPAGAYTYIVNYYNAKKAG